MSKKKDGAIYEHDKNSMHENDLSALKKVKQQRKNKKYKLVRIDQKTWKEIEIKPNNK